MAAAARVLQRVINADQSDFVGPCLACHCGAHARYEGRRDKTFITVLGELTINRAYYYCARCRAGFCPRDRELGLEAETVSPGVQRMIAMVGGTESFADGSKLLDVLAGLKVGTKLLERTAEALGGEVAADERQVFAAELHRQVAPTMYLGMDGTGIPARRSEVDGRSGKQVDGTAKTREVKLCVVWSAESRDKNGIPARDRGSVTYTAAIESAATRDTDDDLSAFAARVRREAERRRFFQAKGQVVLGDGALWIWKLASELFPRAIQIVDRFHAKEHLTKAAKAIWGGENDNYRTWVTDRQAELDSGNIPALLEKLQAHADRCEEARACHDYLKNNRHRMRYAEFHAAGLCTSTGVLEAGCKTAVGARLKRSGMHWTVRGANAITALRCAYLSDRLDAFFVRRAVAKAAA
jgi:hypothetical protein